MSWTAPRTWVTGETLTSTLLNTHLRDNLLTIGGAIGAAYAPAAINTDLAAPTNWMHTIAPTGAGFSVRSIAAAPQAGQLLTLRNTAANPVTLLHATAGGTGAQLNLRGSGSFALAQFEAVTLIYDGATWNEIGRDQASITALLKTTSKLVSNTLTETDLTNGELTVPALRANSWLRCRFIVDQLMNATGNTRFRLKLGAATLADTGANFAPPNSATRYWLVIDAVLYNAAATNAQVGEMGVRMATAVAALTWTTPAASGITSSGSDYEGHAPFTGTVDTTVANVLQLTVQHSVASLNQEVKLYAAGVEVF